VTKKSMTELVSAALITLAALLSWWRASDGRPGWTEISIVWTVLTVILWISYLRTRRRERAQVGNPEEPPE
jgi:hypothetical protein